LVTHTMGLAMGLIIIIIEWRVLDWT